MKISTLIAMDTPLYARGIASALADADEFGPVETVHDPDGVVQAIRASGAHLVVLHVGIGGVGSLLHRVRFEFPDLPIVTLGAREWAPVALQNGASGFVVDDVDAHVFVDGVRRVLRGREFTVVGTVPPTDRPVLTAREHEVVSGAGRGLTNGEIASELGVSEQTVKFHLGNAFRKLGVANRAQAAVAAIRLHAA